LSGFFALMRIAIDLGNALGNGGDQRASRLVPQPDAAWADALFAAVDTHKSRRVPARTEHRL
jgi:hypothetical protein